MNKKEKKYKALYFVLQIKALKNYFSGKNPKGAYQKIQKYLEDHDFSHEQYSGNHSQYKMTDLEIFQFVHKMEPA